MSKIIQSIKSGDKKGAKAMIEAILYRKAAVLVEERKREIGFSLIKEEAEKIQGVS